ncbi:rRNA methylases [Pelotomaculum thermopropionicum SI]|uniref:rRNA methylases n=1 Tax=Pelotomaculum thermopropionicum (strain DSM 13744 / JCM 10971 / SI) TaxID=370438 RepID=A5D0U2_PELTS|nr:rRNA methylases [Pelotomaculum thermopropionicum SI]
MLSRQNSRIKYLRRLGSRRFREKEGKFLIEGVRFVEEALNSAWPVEMLVYCRRITETRRGEALLEKASFQGVPLVEVDESLFGELAGTTTPQGALAVVKKGKVSLEDLQAGGEPALLVIVDGVQDPGNLGTIVRSAGAAGAGGVILLKGTADIFNAKALRATMGAIFYVPVVQDVTSVEAMTYLKQLGIKAVAGDPRGDKLIYDCDLTVPCALVLGSEAAGAGEPVLRMVAERVRIPMPGRAESLNVAVSSAVLLFEAVRQRCFKERGQA